MSDNNSTKNLKNEPKKFEGLSATAKFPICGVPLRCDTYKTCSFGCTYCFANCRKIMEFEKTLQVINLSSVEKRLIRVLVNKKPKEGDLVDAFLQFGLTWHCGGMADPFQPVERILKKTEQLVDITNKHNIHILFSTKSDTVYGANIRPDLHTFQLSVSNIENRHDLEPNVPDITKRYELYRTLKDEGFKVGIRIQPFIPNITSLDIVDMFHDADQITIEGLKLVPQNPEHKEYLLNLTKLDKSDFKQMGLLNLKPEIRLEKYKAFIEKMEQLGIPYSIADNDLHYLGNNHCCCGDRLVHKATGFDSTAMCHKFGTNYTKDDVRRAISMVGVERCKCSQLFTSNRTKGCSTIEQFYDKCFDKKTSPFSPKFLYSDDTEKAA